MKTLQLMKFLKDEILRDPEDENLGFKLLIRLLDYKGIHPMVEFREVIE